MNQAPPYVLRNAFPEHFEILLELRVRALRESLERIGRFDPARARARFRESFDPVHMRLVYVEGELIGCVTVRPESLTVTWIEHFYVDPLWQGRRVGAHILQSIIEASGAEGRTLKLAVLRESDANRFYVRHGFRETHQEAWDIYYERCAGSVSDWAPTPSGA